MAALLVASTSSATAGKPDPCSRDPAAKGCNVDDTEPPAEEKPSPPSGGPIQCHGLDICRPNSDWIRYVVEMADYLLP